MYLLVCTPFEDIFTNFMFLHFLFLGRGYRGCGVFWYWCLFCICLVAYRVFLRVHTFAGYFVVSVEVVCVGYVV